MSSSLRALRGKSRCSVLWLLAPLCVTASLLMAAMWVGRLNSSFEGTASGSADSAAHVERDPAIAAEIAHDIRRFALNALLVPVLDEEGVPARWHDPSLAVACQPGTQVYVNGRPIEPHSEVIGARFSVLWSMEACLPFGAGGPELTGAAEVVAFRGADGLAATVHLRNLHVRHRDHEIVMDTTFVARMD
jgi:hypothetical protein